MNPWEQRALDRCRSVIRFSLWSVVTLMGFMACLFAVAFVYRFLVHLWWWTDRVLFRSPW